MENNKYIERYRHLLMNTVIFIAVVAVLSPFVVWGTYEMAFRNKIYPGIKANLKFKMQNSKLIKLTAENQEWQITREELGVDIDQEETGKKLMAAGRSGNLIDDLKTKIKAYRHGLLIEPVIIYKTEVVDNLIKDISTELYIPVQEPKFKLTGGRVIEFQIGKNGQGADEDLLNSLIVTAIYSDTENIEIPIKIIYPSTQADDKTADELGIIQLLGTGTSTYKGSLPSRKHNVALTAEKLNGILIAPESEFSFNNAIGEVSKETGFQSAYIIQEGRTVLGDGGGVCQGSTTLFRAAMKAGLPITERRAHSYRVGYYEQDSPAGMDATIFAPTADFRFKNDTPAYLLIQTKVDSNNSSLAIEIWGTSDGRTVTTSKPVISDQTPPPPDVYQDDPALKTGIVKQVDWKAWGAKVSFTYMVQKNEELIYKKVFNSVYQPWAAVFLRGTS